MAVSITVAVVNMTIALICGALIGSERQVRQRMAGLRTNALVAMGAASFVVFSQLFPDELSPTRVGAQVVSGIGFLGAGIIFRHGFTVHGLNTAATLWCSAAVGVIAGAGAPLLAAATTGLVIFINLGLRPLVRFIKRKSKIGQVVDSEHHLLITTAASDFSDMKAYVLGILQAEGLTISGFETEFAGAGALICINFTMILDSDGEETLRRVADILMPHPKITALRTVATLDT